jgi:hypothetical protein
MLKNHQLLGFFQRQQESLTNKTWLINFLKPYCFYAPKKMNPSSIPTLQFPKEFAEYLIFLSDKNIQTYMEVGVAHGGSWYFTDSFLRAINPNYKGSQAYDPANSLIDFEPYRIKHKTVVFNQISSSSILLKEPIDLCLIDAVHKEKHVWNDFNKVKNHAKYVAFHDIVQLGRNTVYKVWNKLKQDYPHWEFIDSAAGSICGIGVIQLW